MIFYTNVTLYLLLFLIIILFEFTRKKKVILDTLSFFNVYYLIFYSVAPLGLIILNEVNIPFENIEYIYNIYTPFFSLAFYMFFLLGTKLKVKKIKKINKGNKKNYGIIFVQLCMVVMILLYASGYGGILEAISKASYIRSGYTDRTLFGFLKRFFTIQYILVGMFYILQKKRKKYILFFYLSLILSIITALLLGGRINFLYFSVILLLCYFRLNKEKVVEIIPLLKKIFMTSSFLFILSFLVLYGKRAINSIKYLIKGDLETYKLMLIGSKNSDTGGIINFLSNFSHTSVSIKAAIFTDIHPNYVIDLFSAIINLLPGFSTSNLSIAYLNTYNILGVMESTVPPGMIGFVIYYFSIFAIPFLGMLYGIIWKNLNELFLQLIEEDLIFYPIMIYYSWNLGNGIYTSDIRVDVSKSFPVILFIVFFLWTRKVKFRLR